MAAITSREGVFVKVQPSPGDPLSGALQVTEIGPDGNPVLTAAASVAALNAYLLTLATQVQLTNQILAAFARDRGMNLSDEIKNALTKQLI